MERKHTESIIKGMTPFLPLLEAADGLTLGQVCAVTGLGASTIQNWVKRGFVSRPVGKKYHSRQLARILLINALRDCMKLESIGELMELVNGDANDTGDDIISEEQLYDFLCEIIAAADEKAPSFGELLPLIREVTRDYSSESPENRQRLEKALEIMALAYTAGRYKQEADLRFNSLKEGE